MIKTALILPFRGILYNLKKVKPDAVVAPPYDVIPPENHEKYLKKSEHNIIRLDSPEDEPETDKYADAASRMDEWTKDGILTKDPAPALYLIEHEFRLKSGERKRRKGFIGLLRLEDLNKGTVFPHEKTFPKQKEDRLRLLRATRAHFNPIFSLYSDPGGGAHNTMNAIVAAHKALVEIKDDDNVIHRLWKIVKRDQINELRSIMLHRQIFIADGHHRYETSLKYAQEMRENCKAFHGDEAFNYVMTYFVRMEDDGLEILPVHRLLRGIPDFSDGTLTKKLRKYFNIETANRAQTLASLNAPGSSGRFGIETGKRFHKITLRGDLNLETAMPSMSKKWRGLDASIAQSLIIEPLIGKNEQDQFGKVIYETDPRKAHRKAASGNFQAALYMPPARVEQLIDVVTAREIMPPKSTCFHPKPVSGLVMNRFAPDERFGGDET